ncbi:MAG: glutaredoxin, partial [Eubacteriales bacterium]
MKELTYFRLSYCPHCRRANDYLEELKKENPEYCQIPIKIIDEERDRKTADKFDYWYVPCFFMGDKKLHEGTATKQDIRDVLD